MSEYGFSSRETASGTASKLLDVMDSNSTKTRAAADADVVIITGESGFVQEPNSDAEQTNFGKKMQQPISETHDREMREFDNSDFRQSHGSLESMKKEIETQERIIVTLQRDNEALLREKKEIAGRYKQLENDFEHLEAKHSLLLSAQHDFGARSSLRTAHDNSRIANLEAQMEELQATLEAERRRFVLLTQKQEQSTRAAVTHPSPQSAHEEVSDVLSAMEVADASNSEEPKTLSKRSEENAVKYRESQRTCDLQKAMIDTLHAEVTRLESEKKMLQSRERDLLRELETQRSDIRSLETAMDRKKGSITELVGRLHEHAVDAQRVKKQESRIHVLETALQEKDEFMQKAMERLRAETKEVCSRYEETIAALQRRLEIPTKDPELRMRVATLEKENLELRRAAGSAPLQLSKAKDQIEMKVAAAAAHQPDTELLPERTPPKTITNSPPEDRSVSKLEATVANLTVELHAYNERCKGLQQNLDSLNVDWDARLREVKVNFVLQLQALRASHNEELSRLEAHHQAELSKVSRLTHRDEMGSFIAKLSHVIEEKGYDSSLIAIGERLCYIERRYAQKEEEMALELSQVRHIADLDKKLRKEKMELLLEQKNTQINRFRLQLDELLASISVLQTTS